MLTYNRSGTQLQVMRGDIVHRIYGVHAGRDADTYFGTYRAHAEAEAGIARLIDQHGRAWQERYHNQGFVIRTAAVETDFEVPSLPKPRDKYVALAIPKANEPGTWHSSLVRVHRRGSAPAALEQICEYERNYSMLQTFEPFRKTGLDYALISRSYTKSAVLDLSTGSVIAEEGEMTPGSGFCPVGFYVPDWWDLHDESVIPGNPYWNADNEWPVGEFGFVWGCLWGDDSSWKLQYLDLSRIEEGVLTRDERFGYIELATIGYRSPALSAARDDSGRRSKPPPFIRINRYKGSTEITFALEMDFDLETGACKRWKRTSHPFDD